MTSRSCRRERGVLASEGATMSDTYTKLFSSITESTVWGEPYSTRIVWVTLLAMADAQGHVYGAIPGLARRANVTLAETEMALAAFFAPDPYSRTQAEDGRRIEAIDGGWRLLNHAKYAGIRNEAERAEYKRDWDRRNRPSGHQRALRGSDELPQSDSSPTISDKLTAVRPQSDASPTVRPQSDQSPSKSDSPTPLTPTPTQEKAKNSCASPEGDAQDRIPYQGIIDAYNATLANLPRARELTPKRRTLIRSAWQASPQRRDIRFWQAYFAECQDDDFHNGTGPYREPHANWRPSFDFLMRADVVTKIFEAAMDRMERAP